MKTIVIVGDNYTGAWSYERKASRGFIVLDGKVLLSYDMADDMYMIPGGGREAMEDGEACCIRELAEETGNVVDAEGPLLIIEEYYGNRKYTSEYYSCTILSKTNTCLTEEEKLVGIEPRWIPVMAALEVFSQYEKLSADQEMKSGLYRREYAAIQYYLESEGN